MQQASNEVMKSSQTVVHKKPDWSDSNRSRRFGRWGFNFSEKRSQGLEISAQHIDRPSVTDIKKRSCVYLQAAAKLSDTAHILSRSKHLIGLSKTRLPTIISLPPIKGSRTISGKKTLTANKKSEETEEKQVIYVMVKRHGKINQESIKSSKICVAPAAGNKAFVKDSGTCSRWIQKTLDSEPAVKSTPAPVDPPVQQKNDTSVAGANEGCTMKPKHDASLSKGLRLLIRSNDSAIETESGLSVDKGRLERLQEDSNDEEEEYYTEQRITEWVLAVNSSFFYRGDHVQESLKPTEEQDVATIKIIYNGD
ncbi:hypothetical protein GBF38_021878 [Xyrichtys novacula]|uniref:Uncharacterized protein n=1 Tax=Xyrichtys novacula TaxID=13765 RepID=A0AAV1GMW7_XYRNO|nr:hypothetical protein GBF38_021878 [Xyrichtys novacula]